MKAKNKEVKETRENNSAIWFQHFSSCRLRMTEIFQQFQTWLFESRSFLFSWFSKDRGKLQEPEKSLEELPANLREKLVAATQKLPSNSADQQAVQSALDEALEEWLAHSESADNSIVFLTSPLSALSRILTESLADWSKKQQVSLRFLPWNSRPQEPEEIQTKLEQDLEQEVSTTNIDNSQQSELVIIPNLSWCFLRCVEGLDGIDYLQDLLLRDRSRFWVIGSDQVAWQYLKSVFNLQAYCSEAITLPELDGEQLQTWLEPIVEELEITFATPSLDSQLFDEDKSPKTQYFENLANVSEGVSTVAVQVFLNSITYQSPEEETELASGILEAETPNLPDLPPLEQQDYYLLYSLLLHGDMTFNALAQSLGDEHFAVQDRVQILRRKGVIEQRNQVLKINSIHYPKLKQRLANNNFIIDEID